MIFMLFIILHSVNESRPLQMSPLFTTLIITEMKSNYGSLGCIRYLRNLWRLIFNLLWLSVPIHDVYILTEVGSVFQWLAHKPHCDNYEWVGKTTPDAEVLVLAQTRRYSDGTHFRYNKEVCSWQSTEVCISCLHNDCQTTRQKTKYIFNTNKRSTTRRLKWLR